MCSEPTTFGPPLTNDAGFSLVELMIAIAIFAIGVMAVGSLQISAIDGNGGARKLSDELVLAESLLEELMAKPYDDDDLKDSTVAATYPHTRVGGPSNVYTMTWNIVLRDLNGDGTNDAKRIELTVTHSGNANRRVTLHHIIPDPNA